MSGSEQYILIPNFVIILCAAFITTLFATRSTIFEKIVLRRLPNSRVGLWFAEMLTCPMCVGMWATLIVWLVVGGMLIEALGSYILVVFLMALYDHLTFNEVK